MNRSKVDIDKEDGKFKRVQYTCHRNGKKIKSRGTGERPNQKYYANGCQCQVYMRFKK
jgi:hypothetical protein